MPVSIDDKGVVHHERARKRTRAYALAALISILLWAVVTYYHFLRRGVWNPFAPHELNALFLSNKGLALTAVLMICLSVILGPMARWCPRFAGWVGYRREIGLAGAALACMHVPVSLLLLPDNFPLSWFAEHPAPLALGIATLAILIVITMHSTHAAQRRLGFRKWKMIQRLVYPAIVFVSAHYMLMGKPANWLKWSRTLETPLPPGTLVITVIIILTLAARLICLRGARS